MATYQYPQFLSKLEHQAFNIVTEPGHAAPFTGIYRCDGCGHEAGSTQGHHLPPQNHHQHTAAQGKIRWRLIVATTHR